MNIKELKLLVDSAVNLGIEEIRIAEYLHPENTQDEHIYFAEATLRSVSDFQALVLSQKEHESN